VIFVDGGSVPENFTGLIKKEEPSHILIIDAVLMGTEPGTIKFVNKDDIEDINVSSHSMPLSFLIKYLESYIDFNFLFIGIEPLSLNLGEDLSGEVLKSIRFVKEIIISVL
jgi:hydrogenase 3 maturation protease